jgi:hypothetical protein
VAFGVARWRPGAQVHAGSDRASVSQWAFQPHWHRQSLALPSGTPIGSISAKTFILAKEIRAIRTKSLRGKKSFRDHVVEMGE